jgi:hypothetical protein
MQLGPHGDWVMVMVMCAGYTLSMNSAGGAVHVLVCCFIMHARCGGCGDWHESTMLLIVDAQVATSAWAPW